MADSTGSEYMNVLDRRKFLALTGTTGAAALAGCTGGGGDGGEMAKNSSEDHKIYNETFDMALNGNPVDLHFNAFNPQNFEELIAPLLFDRWMAYSFTEDKFLPAAVTSVKFADDLKSATTEFRDDLKWDNGDAVKPKDIKTVLELMKKTDEALWQYLSGYKITNDKPITVRFNFPQKTNPKILKFQFTNSLLCAKYETHKKFLDKSASEILQYQWTDNVLSSGPLSFVKKDKQAFEFKLNKHYYNYNELNFNEYQIDSYGGNTAQQQALMSPKNVDAAISLFVPPQTYKQFPEKVAEINIPAKWGYGIVFNHKDPDFGKRKVRQAIAHLIDREAMVKNAGPRTKFPTPTPCGIAPKDVKPWLGDDMKKFETYGVGEQQKDEAAKLLKDAGYSKKGGVWTDTKRGSKLGGNYYSPAGWTDWTTMTNTVVSQLNDFGFDLKIATKPTNDWNSKLVKSDFRISAFYWLPGGSRSTFPYYPLRYQLVNTTIKGGHNYPADKKYTIPAMNGKGTMTINPLKTVKNIATTPDKKAAQPHVRRAAWHNNIDLPMLSLISKYEQSWMTKDEWTIVDKDNKHRQVKWPQTWWLREGKLDYIPESKR
jgi:peptide/nickel transport system substrate-binding protein